MRESEKRPDMAALWGRIALPDEQASASPPAVSINTVHGSVLSIVTAQAVNLSDLWAQVSAEQRSRQPREA